MDTPSVEVTLAKDSTLSIRTSLTPGSRDTASIWKRSAAETLGIQADMVSIEPPDTDTVPDSESWLPFKKHKRCYRAHRGGVLHPRLQALQGGAADKRQEVAAGAKLKGCTRIASR
ncbi:hypothetical protein MASR2M48_27070 [Spirochaetota bacterium]